jgi:sulfatase maturation enzyme AslB (radical SAM superfamily)
MLPVEPNPSFNAIENRVRPIETLVIQATPFCNLDCAYCYLPHRNDRRHMEMETLDLVCRRAQPSPHFSHNGINVLPFNGQQAVTAITALWL